MKYIDLTPKSMEHLGDILRELRAEKQISQEAVAKKLHAKQPFISGMENQKKAPTLRTFLRFMKAIDCKVRIIIEE